MSPRLNLLLIATVVIVILIRMSVFTVDQRDYAVKFQFREIIQADYKPGLHFKVPFVQNVERYPKRIINLKPQAEKFLTGEKKNLIVDYFVMWRIIDPAQYYRAVRGDETLAVERLSAIIKEGIKAAISQRTVQQVVSARTVGAHGTDARRPRASARRRSGSRSSMCASNALNSAEEVSESVYNRMRQERQRVASQLRAEGDEEYERIRADADRQRTVILSEAYRDAERIRGTGDARAAEIYAEAYSKDRDFYAFYRSMQAYRQSIGREQDVLVLQPDSDFFRFLQNQLGTSTK